MIHQRNLQTAVSKTFQVKMGTAPQMMNIFSLANTPYKLRDDLRLKL